MRLLLFGAVVALVAASMAEAGGVSTYYRYTHSAPVYASSRPTLGESLYYRIHPQTPLRIAPVVTTRVLPSYYRRPVVSYPSRGYRLGFADGFEEGFDHGRVYERYRGPYAPSPCFDRHD